MSNENPTSPVASSEQPGSPGLATEPAAASDAATAPEASIPLPPPATPVPETPPMTPERLALEMTRLDGILVAVVLLLTFFLASFTATNSDFWLHLATGRLIANGQYRFGTDPFAYTTDSVPWINHTWLYDLGLYLIAGAPDRGEPALHGAVLVVIKAAALTLLAGLLLLIRRPGQSLWIPAVCIALAVLAMSQRFILTPLFFTLLFLGLTLYLLASGADRGPEDTTWTTRKRLLLIPLFALWVNLDDWFILGPVTVALYLIGETLQRFFPFPETTGQEPPRPRELGVLAIVLGAGVAACILNPFHVRAFATLPNDLLLPLLPDNVREDALFQTALSPLDYAYLFNSDLGLNVVGLSYLVLGLLGLGSFALCYSCMTWQWWRVVVWLAFLFLSLWQHRMIAFFAVVAGPITALNLQEYAARQFGTRPRLDGYWVQWSIFGRIGTIVAAVLLVLLAWPGWLSPFHDDARRTRRVSWEVWSDPSWRQAAEQLYQWRQDKVLTAQGFHFLPDMAHYCAWFAPGEKGFFDNRVQLFVHTVPDFVDVRRTLGTAGDEQKSKETSEEGASWPRILRSAGKPYHIDHVVVNSVAEATCMERLWLQSDEWVWLYGDGRTAIFGWRDPERPADKDRFASLRIDDKAMAYGPDLPDRCKSPPSPPRLPQAPSLVDRYWNGPPARPLELDEANLYLSRFTIEGSLQQQRQARVTPPQLIGFWGGIVHANPAGLGVVPLLADGANLWFVPLVGDMVPRPPAPPESDLTAPLLLALRASRRAIAASPESADAYFTLAIVLRLLTNQQKALAGPCPRLDDLRQIQIVTALQNAITLNPENPDAHQALAVAFEDLRYRDLAMDQWNEWFTLYRDRVPKRGRETEEEWQERTTRHAKNILAAQEFLKDKEARHEIDARRDRYENAASATNIPLAQAEIALLRWGLAGKAMEILEKALASAPAGSKDSEAFRPVMELYLTLLVRTGQLDKVLKVDYKPRESNGVYLHAALGDYDKADEYLTGVLAQQDLATREVLRIARGQMLHTILVPKSLFDLSQWAAMQQEWAEWRTIRGLLALEAGNTTLAAEAFARAARQRLPENGHATAVAFLASQSPLDHGVFLLGWSNSAADPGLNYSLRPLAARYEALLQAAGSKPVKKDAAPRARTETATGR